MEHTGGVGADRLAQQLDVADVADHRFDPSVVDLRRREVERHDAIEVDLQRALVGSAKQFADHAAAEESGATGNDDFHGCWPFSGVNEDTLARGMR